MRIKRTAVTVLGSLALAGLLIGLPLFACGFFQAYDGISIRLGDAPVPEKKLKRLLEQEGDGLKLTAAWKRGQPVPVAGGDLGTSAQARPVAACGDMRQICPMELLSGSYPVDGDFSGCLITADLAMTLFHSVDAVGAGVVMSGETYRVRGIASAYEPMVIVRGGDETAYENLEFVPANLSGGAAYAEAFLYRNGLNSACVTVQSGLYGRMLRGLAFLPAALFCLLSAGLLFRASRSCRGRAVGLGLLLAAGPALLALLILRNTFYWPEIYLPTKCADFAFWRELLALWQKSWKAMALATPLPKDVQFYRAARATACVTAGALMGVVALYRRIGRMLPAGKQRGGEKLS